MGQAQFRSDVDEVGAGGHRRVVKSHGLAARSGAVDVEHAPCRIALEEPPAEITKVSLERTATIAQSSFSTAKTVTAVAVSNATETKWRSDFIG